MPMNKGLIAEDRFSLSKPNSEIKEIISEILKGCSINYVFKKLVSILFCLFLKSFCRL